MIGAVVITGAVIVALILAASAVRHRYTRMDRWHKVCSPEKSAWMMRDSEARDVRQVVVLRDDQLYRGGS